MDWFLYDKILRHARVKGFWKLDENPYNYNYFFENHYLFVRLASFGWSIISFRKTKLFFKKQIWLDSRQYNRKNHIDPDLSLLGPNLGHKTLFLRFQLY